MIAPIAPISSAGEPTPWFGQPRGLTILFLTNMWEQFSYFGMRALLVFYMTKQLLLSPASASVIYGAYTACAYLTPIAGGFIADRYLGKRRAIIVGGSIMAVGHFMMAFEPAFYFALGTIAIGNGLFLPSLPSQINDLYSREDPRRGWAYNVYYVGINIGGFLAPLICGTLGELYGWHYGFGAAGIGMVAGLLIYLSGQRYLPDEAPRAAATIKRPWFEGFSRDTLIALLAVALSVMVFRGAYEQVGNSVALWGDSSVNRTVGSFVIPVVDWTVGSFSIPVTWFFSLNPLFVILMTPPLLAYWARRAASGRDGSPARRMAMGALVVAGSYLVLALAASLAGATGAHWLWFAGFFIVFTFGELLILPTGLGLFARLAPQGMGATTVAAWYLTIFSGSLAAGFVGTLSGAMSPELFFVLFAGIAVVAAGLLASLNSRVRQAESANSGEPE